MRIAVIEHRLQGEPLLDARVLAEEARRASDGGAEVVLFPHVLAVDEQAANEEFVRLTEGIPGTRLLPRIGTGVKAQVFPVTDQVPVLGERLGRIGLLYGDAVVNPEVLRRTADAAPALLVLTPGAESDLQAEAFLELAIGLSESAAGLVVVAEATGAEPGEPGHGGTAIVLLGEVLAEALGDDGDILFADVPEPPPVPETPQPIPELPTILEQRLANHEGRKPAVGYPADLT